MSNVRRKLGREVIETVRREEPDLFDDDLKAQVVQMMSEAVDCEVAFAEDTLSGGVAGLSIRDIAGQFEGSPEISTYLGDVRTDLIANAEMFLQPHQQDEESAFGGAARLFALLV